MPKKLIDILFETERKVETLRGLGSSNRQLKEGEIATIATCTTRAEALLTFLEQFSAKSPSIAEGTERPGWAERTLLGPKRVRLAFKVKFEEKTLIEYQSSLDNVLRIVEIQMQSRTEYIGYLAHFMLFR